jgi:2-polyprenyl-3-methyl-5-hydroxy-6-metoxy-1,4-benzoquinol methylase
MSQPAASEPIKSLSARALATWDIIAPDWDAAITADGNKYWRRLQEPSLRRLLSPTLLANCRRALDLATGNGLCARWLLARGAVSVLATDGSEGMLELARGHGHGYKVRKVDVTSEKDLGGLVEEEALEGFDVVLMNMAIMDVGDLEPLAKALKGGLLAQDGV